MTIPNWQIINWSSSFIRSLLVLCFKGVRDCFSNAKRRFVWQSILLHQNDEKRRSSFYCTLFTTRRCKMYSANDVHYHSRIDVFGYFVLIKQSNSIRKYCCIAYWKSCKCNKSFYMTYITRKIVLLSLYCEIKEAAPFSARCIIILCKLYY